MRGFAAACAAPRRRRSPAVACRPSLRPHPRASGACCHRSRAGSCGGRRRGHGAREKRCVLRACVAGKLRRGAAASRQPARQLRFVACRGQVELSDVRSDVARRQPHLRQSQRLGARLRCGGWRAVCRCREPRATRPLGEGQDVERLELLG
eukprot:2129514-Prymnesium_polylepis.1